MVSKSALKDELVRLLAADLEGAVRAQSNTLEGATHAEAKPENDKDTRALEQSYLARGQARRVEELRADLALAEQTPVVSLAGGARIVLGALVEVEENDATSLVWLAPARGGTTLAEGVKVITPGSPLGRGLLGKTEGDELEVRVGDRVRALVVTRVS